MLPRFRRTVVTGGEGGDPVHGESVCLPGDFVLCDQGPAHPRIGAAMRVAPRQQLSVDPVGGQFVGRQVNTAALQVLVDVTQKLVSWNALPSAAA